MERIFILGEHRGNRQSLTEILQEDYLVFCQKPGIQALEESFDLAIVDREALERLQKQIKARKEEITPDFLPFLLIVGHQEMEMATHYLRQTVDDLIILPIKKVELQARVAVLLLARQQSLELKEKQKIIESGMKESLQESEARFRAAIQTSPDSISITRLEDGEIIDVNDGFCRLTGFPREVVIGKKSADIDIWVNPQQRLEFAEHLKRDGYIENMEVLFRMADGRQIHSLLSSRVFVLKGEAHLLNIAKDIENLKQTQQALRDSEDRYRHLVEGSPFPMAVYIDQKIYFSNLAAVKVMGAERLEEVVGKPFMEFVHPDSKKLVEGRARRFSSGEALETAEEKIITLNGEIRNIQVNAARIRFDNKDAVLTQFIDITERKRIEEALSVSDAELRALFAAMNDVVLVIDREGVYREIAPTRPDLLYKSPQELLGKSLRDVFLPEQAEAFISAIQNALQTQQTVTVEYELPIGGQMYHFEAAISPMTADSTLWVARDITERASVEQERRLLATAIEHSTEAVFITDAQNKFIYVNQAFEQIYGYTQADVFGKTPHFLVSDRHDQYFFTYLKDTIFSGKPWRGYLFNRQKNGQFIEVHATITPIFDNAETLTHFVSVHRDMTREREIERRSQQSQRLEAVGTLAGGIAHDFNNILTPIIGYAELCRMATPAGSQLYSDLEHISVAANRARELVRQILSFSRQSRYERKPLLMSPIIEEALTLLRATLPATIEIEQEIEPGDLLVVADATQIHQIIMNLCTNAYQAMPQGGTLKIKLQEVEVDRHFAETHPGLSPGIYLELTVRDTGVGIPPEILDKIFEPYFTTKGEESGTGMGLATVHGIVASYGGMTTVYSEAGQGTEFKLYFPALSEDTTEEDIVEQPVEGGNESILFVDDEEAIAKLGATVLGSYGYAVTSVTHPQQALERLRKDPDAFDLLITDMTMPDITGDLLALEAQKLHPGIPIILCTGFSDRIDAERARQLGIGQFLNKPFSFKQLAMAARELLDEAASE